MDVPRGQVGPRAAALVLVLDVHRAAGGGWQGGVPAAAGLDARFLVGRQDVLIGPQGLALPRAGVEIQDPPGLGRKRRVAREDPTAMAPRAQGVLAEPAPQRGLADLGDQPWATAACCRSRTDQRARGSPRCVGSSHARALTATTTLGGKAGWSPAPRQLLEAGQPTSPKPLAPLADDLARQIEAGRDDVIRQALGGQ